MKTSIRMTATPLFKAAVLLALVPGLSRIAEAHDMAMHRMHEQATPLNVSVKIANKPLIDQEGHALRLKDDVIGDRIVVLTFVYTHCTTVCPVVSSILSDLQNKLGSRLGADVRLVTLTVDPVRDTPSRLKIYSKQFDAKPGWFWLTGSSANVTTVLKGLGAYTPNFENHPVIVMIGDGRTGKWSRHYALSSSEHLLSAVNEYVVARNNAVSAKAVELPLLREAQRVAFYEPRNLLSSATKCMQLACWRE